MPVPQEAVNTWDETAAGTNAGATATHTGTTGKTHIVRHISGHTDADSLIQILGGAAGTTVIWESKVDVSVNGFGFSIPIPDGIRGNVGIAVAGKVATSTANCRVNIAGYSAP